MKNFLIACVLVGCVDSSPGDSSGAGFASKSDAGVDAGTEVLVESELTSNGFEVCDGAFENIGEFEVEVPLECNPYYFETGRPPEDAELHEHEVEVEQRVERQFEPQAK